MTSIVNPTPMSGEPSDAAEHEARRSWVLDLLRAMAVVERQDEVMIRLVYVQGLSHRQIAERLDVALSAVHRGVARGMRQIGEGLMRGGKPAST